MQNRSLFRPPPLELVDKLRVLVVDDSPTMRGYLDTALRRLGHEVRACESYTAALGVAKEWPPHIAIIDVMLHGSPRGIGLGEVLREGWPETSVGLISGYRYTQDQQRQAESAVGGGLLLKPIPRSALVEMESRVRRGQAVFPTLEERGCGSDSLLSMP